MRKTLHVLVACFATFLQLASIATAATPPFKIDEAKFSASVGQDRIVVRVPISNTGASAASAWLRLELIDPDDHLIATNEVGLRVAAGTHVATARLNLDPRIGKGDEEKLSWYRLRYRLASHAAYETIATGTLALGRLDPNLFQLETVYSQDVMSGDRCVLRVRAVNPVSRRPVAGVAVRGEFLLEGEDVDREVAAGFAAGLTDATGSVVLRRVLSAELRDPFREVTVRISARKGAHVREQTVSLYVGNLIRTVISTDKVLYQPGQSLHARALVVDGHRKAAAGLQLAFELSTPDGELISRSDATTNEFGIASIDTTLPDDAKAGQYRLRVRAPVMEDSHALAMADIPVRRYDLPNFTVSATPDRSYYLPGQSAVMEVAANYLFGKPVTRGAVRLVREESRTWDYKKQAWEVQEEGLQSSVLDAGGRATFRLDLTPLYKDVDEDRRFRDYTYAAFVTDDSTGRTEQRRVQLRISREPIHVYAYRFVHADNKLSFYVTASYADGSPAEAAVNVYRGVEGHRGPLLRALRTNRYGVAKADLIPMEEIENEPTIFLAARDRKGSEGHREEDVRDRPQIAVSTDKALYRAGEPIKVSLRADASVLAGVDVMSDTALLWSTSVRLRRNEAFLVVPFQQSFKGPLHVRAHLLDAVTRHSLAIGVHTVLYPEDRELRVAVRPARRDYAPGDDVTAAVRISTAAGAPARGALGVVVADKAVEERARTDNEFGYAGGFWNWSVWEDRTSVGGVSFKDLNRLDLSEEVPEGLDLAAEVLLNAWGGHYMPLDFEADDDYLLQASRAFAGALARRLSGVKDLLERARDSNTDFPEDDAGLDRLLNRHGLDRTSLVDPWGTPFAFQFSVQWRERHVRATSAGPDKIHFTADDLTALDTTWNYFTPIGKVIDAALGETTQVSGTCIQDYASLRAAVAARGLDLDSITDPWGGKYLFSFRIDSRCRVDVATRPPHGYRFEVWASIGDYFARIRPVVRQALASGAFPRNDTDFDKALETTGLRFRELRDPWGRPYFVTFTREVLYTDKRAISSDSRTQTTPVTAYLEWVNILSAGGDGVARSADDITLLSVSQTVGEQSGAARVAQRAESTMRLLAGTGGIRGVVNYISGAVIPGATVAAIRDGTETSYSAITNADGSYTISDVMPGTYRVTVSLAGFRTQIFRDVPVTANAVTVVNVTLRVARLEETVTVMASAELVQTTRSVAMSTTSRESPGPGNATRPEISTPRLRDFFPETLYWAPSVATDTSGNARLRFKLADSITTWKMSIVASTVNGEVGTADLELLAFQPFFVEHDPPKVLTVGDDIDLPVVLRNYTATRQDVNVEMKPANWFTMRGAGAKATSVEPGTPARVVFPFTVTSATAKGGQQVSATGRTAADRMEKQVAVHPNGEERTVTVAGLLRGTLSLPVPLPADVIEGSARTTIKLYPNLLAHVVESLEAGLQRPYGCAEQVISSTYPSVLLLGYYKEAHVDGGETAARARKYLRDGLERLRAYRNAAGGFGYWKGGDADPGVTAYAIQFLLDASSLTAVDENLAIGAVRWLVEHQADDGTWRPRYGGSETLTTFVARVLASAPGRLPEDEDNPIKPAVSKAVERVLRAVKPEEPYAMAQLAQAAWEIGRTSEAQAIAATLRGLSHREGNGVYWALETNTPFYGWGLAGRLETTAVVVKALSTIDGAGSEARPLIDGGVIFLLKQKDRYGVWYSGQATTCVLKALLGVLGGAAPGPLHAAVFVNGNAATVFDAPASTAAALPLVADVSSLMKPGANTVELRHGEGSGYASVQVVSNYYVPWRVPAQQREATETGDSRALRLSVKPAKMSGNVGDEIEYAVEVERAGHRGYGMLIAEVGLPPGADVDRASLNRVVERAGWAVSSYEVQPDRVVFYVWPTAGGTQFKFAFRSRFAMKALSAPSVLYDYYNPESQVTVPPVMMHISQAPTASSASSGARRPH